MTDGKFGRIQEVSLQDAWPDEAKDFTPWLAENLDELGVALRIPLQLHERESSVGTRKLDIFATDPEGNPVVIENQIYPTDDNHLGRLLIYAAGKDAKLVIWVAREIGGEHQMALNWLNQRTDGNTQFYGVTVEALKIDNSKPAPRFSVVVRPARKVKGPLNERERQNIEFRRPLAEMLEPKIGKPVVTDPDTAGYWCVIEYLVPGSKGSGKLAVGWGGKTLTLALEITRKGSPQGLEQNRRVFQSLDKQRADIESNILNPAEGDTLEWDITEAGGRIFVSRPGDIYENPDSWGEYHDWIIAKFFKFKEVFTPLLAELSTAAGETE